MAKKSVMTRKPSVMKTMTAKEMKMPKKAMEEMHEPGKHEKKFGKKM